MTAVIPALLIEDGSESTEAPLRLKSLNFLSFCRSAGPDDGLFWYYSERAGESRASGPTCLSIRPNSLRPRDNPHVSHAPYEAG
jgi:hypothetical protein